MSVPPGTESASATLRRVEQERDTAAWQRDGLAKSWDAARVEVDQLSLRVLELRDELAGARNELDAERDKRAEDIAAYERACGLAAVAERERDEARDEARRLRDQLGFADARIRELGAKRPTPHLDAVKAELASARTELDAVRTARDRLDRQLAVAFAEITDLERDLTLCPRCGIELNADITGGTSALASWIVARDGGRNCVSCGREIRRGEAYELMPGIDEDRHIHCPDRTEENHG